MNFLRVFLFLPILLVVGVSCSRHPLESASGGAQAVLNCEDYKNLIVAPVVIDGKTCHLLVDTGASHTLLRKDVVAKFWPEKPVRLLQGDTSSNIAGPLFFTPVSSMSSDSFHVRNFYVIVADLAHLGNMGSVPVAGMLGMDILGNSPMMIDVAGGKVTFFARTPSADELKALGAVRVPIRRDGNHVRANLLVDGKPMQFIIDTGATQSCVDRRTWKGKVHKSKGKMQWVDVNGVNNLNEFDYGVVDRLKWGDVMFQEMVVFFESREKILGGDVLRKGKLLIDRPSGKAWWIAR